MRISRQHACYLIAILFLCCLIQSEKEWIENLTDWQAENLSKTTESLLEQYQRQIESVWEELIYFPIPDSALSPNVSVSFQNTWQAERNYGGKRKHEGIDLMADPDKSGYFPIVSMTDGTIEQVGWLEKGGWADWNPVYKWQLLLLCTFSFIYQRLEKGRSGEGRRCAGIYG